MNRTEYLSNPDVLAFINHLVASFDAGGFSHSWVSYDKKSTGIAVGERWHCEGIRGAIENYYWPSKDPASGEKVTSLVDTELLLGRLGRELHDAIEANNVELARTVCRKILRWGGVEDKPMVAPDMKDPAVDLLALLNRVRSQCQLQYLDLSELQENGQPWLRIDSGTTKVFSLLLPGFAMLDSRVGCALAILSSQFWLGRGKCLSDLPSLLRFSWGGHASSRNPNPGARGQAIFAKLDNTGIARAEQNFQVSWLLGDVAQRLQHHAFFHGKPEAQIVRELEAGLFMIGYGVEHSARIPGKKGAKAKTNGHPTKKDIAKNLYETDAESPVSRREFIQGCIELGINANTASTYFAEFNRAARNPA